MLSAGQVERPPVVFHLDGGECIEHSWRAEQRQRERERQRRGIVTHFVVSGGTPHGAKGCAILRSIELQ